MIYHWNWNILFEPSPEGNGTYLDLLIMGLGWTIATSICACILALVSGTLVAVVRTLPSRLCERLGFAYVELFRNIPLVVQLFLWFFVMPEFLPAAWSHWLKSLHDGPFFTAVVGIGFYMSARVAEQVRSGLNAIAGGQRRAALAVGLTLAQSYRYVLLPITFRIILPALTSEALNTVKNSSVALTIGLLELTSRARAMQEYSFQVFEAFATATAIYLVLNLIVVQIMRRLERRVALPGFMAGEH